ncbi:hypothetical protein [Olivibacter sp. XZL3]|uniref:hypothetical protein n=1 Tax=Olivibacter sp. XZL3 TaxID=1735116 RepID=UPI001065FB68|nr:hypothetical protein [Olivibacter sp. XZL3]
MTNSTLGSVPIKNSIKHSASFINALMAVARGMKKDGFSDVEIAKETNLSLSLIMNLKIKRQSA